MAGIVKNYTSLAIAVVAVVLGAFSIYSMFSTDASDNVTFSILNCRLFFHPNTTNLELDENDSSNLRWSILLLFCSVLMIVVTNFFKFVDGKKSVYQGGTQVTEYMKG